MFDKFLIAPSKLRIPLNKFEVESLFLNIDQKEELPEFGDPPEVVSLPNEAQEIWLEFDSM